MRADKMEMQRLGEGGEHPSSLEARAGAFLHEACPTTGLRETEIGAIGERLFQRGRPRAGMRLVPVFAALAVLFAAGTVMAVVSGWRPRVPFLENSDETPGSPATPPAKARSRSTALVVPIPAPFEPEYAQPSEPAPAAGARPLPTARRIARAENSPASASPLPEGALSVEARSLADALARWRRDGNAEAALALLATHERRFPSGALWVESRVARAEILLALSRREQALAVLDSLGLANLPRARELQTLRGELRAQAGRCQDARADLSPVLSRTATDDFGKRAARALATCP
jgi:hypothetical protein